jgi:hypothetical protein
MAPRNNYTVGQLVTVNVKGEPVQAKYLGWSEAYNMPIVEVAGKRLYRKIQDTLGARVHNPEPVKQSRFDVNQRFEFIEQVTDMVVSGESNSVIITGSGGLGKTFTVTACLRAAGLEQTTGVGADAGTEEEEDEDAGGDYEVVKGYVTPKALYRLLYNNRERLLVFDDCDSVWDNPTTVSLLKAALDSYETRHISWFSESKSDEDDLPQQFEFKGKIIFVSNLRLTDLDQAVLSRCVYVDVSMTAVEKVERIKALAPKIRPDLPKKMKDESISVIEEHAENIGDLNIRTFLKVLEIRHKDTENWRDLAEYVITAL